MTSAGRRKEAKPRAARLTDDAERLQLVERTQPGREATLDALSDVPVTDSQGLERGQTAQCVPRKDGFWVVHQLQSGQCWATVPGHSYRTK